MHDEVVASVYVCVKHGIGAAEKQVPAAMHARVGEVLQRDAAVVRVSVHPCETMWKGL